MKRSTPHPATAYTPNGGTVQSSQFQSPIELAGSTALARTQDGDEHQENDRCGAHFELFDLIFEVSQLVRDCLPAAAGINCSAGILF